MSAQYQFASQPSIRTKSESSAKFAGMADIKLDNVHKRFGQTTVIDHLSLSVKHGEFFTLLGPSGCGKTTLLRMIAGFVEPTEGRIFIGDQDVTYTPAHKRETGMVFQDYALFPDKTVFDNVAYGLRVRKVASKDIQARVMRILERVELAHLPTRYPGELSGGQRQRVALARALVIEPRILLMDEPLSNLDAKLRIQMRDVIRQLQQELQITTVFVTHDQEEALSMSDRIALLRNGRIDQLDSPEQLYSRPVSAYAADFIGAANLITVQQVEHRSRQTFVTIAGGQVIINEIVEASPTLAIRPEHIIITSRDQSDGIRATVIYRRYLGFKVTYCLKLPDGNTINADIASPLDQRFRPEDEVRILVGDHARLVSGVKGD